MSAEALRAAARAMNAGGTPLEDFVAGLTGEAAQALLLKILAERPEALEGLVKRSSTTVKARFARELGRGMNGQIVGWVPATSTMPACSIGPRHMRACQPGDRPVGVLLTDGVVARDTAEAFAQAQDESESLVSPPRIYDERSEAWIEHRERSREAAWARVRAHYAPALPPPEAMHGAEVTPDERTPEQRDREAGIP